jgi:hypothetical protein
MQNNIDTINEQQFDNRSVLDGQIDRRAEKRCHYMI